MNTLPSQVHPVDNPGDLGDWDNHFGATVGDPYDLIVVRGVVNGAGPAADIPVMNVIGWNTNGGNIRNVPSGGVVNGLAAPAGFVIDVYPGGTAQGSFVMALGEEQVYGSDVYGTVGSGGEMLVYSGGAASDTVVDSGGFEYVFSGGTASNTTVSGGTLELGAAGVVDSSGGADVAGPDTNPSSDSGGNVSPGGNAGDADAVASGGAAAGAPPAAGASGVGNSIALRAPEASCKSTKPRCRARRSTASARRT